MKFVPVIWFSACLFCCIQISAANPPTLETWSDFDQAVEDAYDGLINSTSVLPVGNDTYEIFQGYCLLSYGGEIESATNLFRYSPRMGIPAWTVRLTETQGVERVWLCEGEGSACFRTNRVPSGFNVRQWVDDYYGQVPAWLNAAEGDEWYSRRDRSRLRMTLSLIASNNWSLLADEWQSAMNNSPASQLPYRRAPSDKNRVAFTAVEYPGEAFLRFWIYSLTNPVPVEIYSSELLPTNGLWSFAGLLDGQGVFDLWRMPIAAGSLKGVYNAARGDIDSDGDGIPDGREVLVHGTSTVLDDSDGDGLSDLEELYRYETNPNQSDSDADSIPDGWEVNRGMNPLNPSDIYLDPDNDHLYNLHEYWIGSDPQVAETNSYAIADAMAAVDLSISGLVVTTSINIFTTQDHSATNYLRNTNCWAAAYDLTCCSPWNSYASGYWSGVHHAGTLISPRHLLFAAHFDQIPTNSIIRFVDLENNVVERKLVAKKQHPDYPPGHPAYYPDLTVGLLDSDVPTNQISFAKVLPDGYREYIGSGRFLPALCLDQEEKALIADLVDISQTNLIEGINQVLTLFDYPIETNRLNYSEEIIVGDSGNPAFLVLNGELVLLALWTYGDAGAGSSITAFKDGINQLMTDLSGGYQLTEFDLSGFDALDVR